MNQVRRISRLYAERYGRRDHFDRQRESQRRAQKQQSRIMRHNEAKAKVAQKNSGKAFHEPKRGQPKPRFRDKVARMFRRQGR